MKKSEKNKMVLDNFILWLTHCDNTENEPHIKAHVTYTPELLYKMVENYIAEDHVDGEGGDDETIKYPRKCCVTGEGMSEGWYDESGQQQYFKYEKDVLNHIKAIIDSDKEFKEQLKINDSSKLSNDRLFDIAYNHYDIYWTSWEDTIDDDEEWYTLDGKIMSNSHK